VILTVLAAVFAASQTSYAGVIDSYVANLGNAERTYTQSFYWAGWGSWDRLGNNVSYAAGYSWSSGGWNTTQSTWLQVALPSYTGNITAATLFVNVTDFSVLWNGEAAVLYHTFNSSSATGDATQGLKGDGIVSGVNNPALGWFGLDVTPFIQHDYEQNYGWAAFQFNPVDGAHFSFSIAEPGSASSAPGNAPYLRITTNSDGAPGDSAAPEPGTLLMFALGGTALLLRTRAKGSKIVNRG
jgi:hypothetical protein